MELAGALNQPASALELDYIGLNHLSWIRGISIDGANRTAEALAAFRGLTINKAVSGESPAWLQSDIDLLQAIPNYYLLYYYAEKAWIDYQSTHPTRASEVMAIEDSLMEKFADPNLVTKPEELMQRGGAYYSDSAAELMADIYQDAGTIHIVNTLNNGAVPGFADSAVMEIPARITKNGAQAIPTQAMSPEIASLVAPVKDFEMLTIDAAITGNEESALLALLANPIGPDITSLRDLWQVLRRENQGLIGLFNE